jgi:serine/threonine-protein kinase
MGNLLEARRHLDSAWSEGYQSPDVAYALGVTYGGLYSQEQERSRRIADEEQREEALAQARSQLMEPAIRFLAGCREAFQVSPEYLEGLIALYQERYEEGLQIASIIPEEPEWYVERHMLKGDLYRRFGQKKGTLERDVKKEQELLAQAAIAYEQATATARSLALAYQRLCDVRTRAIDSCFYSLDCNITEEDVDEAATPCRTALTIDPEMVEAQLVLAGSLVQRARVAGGSGDDPLPFLRQASRIVLRAISLDPSRSRSHAFSAWVHQAIGLHLRYQGREAEAALDHSIAAARTLLELTPGDVSAASSLGVGCHMRALAAVERGEDPLPWLEPGIEAVRNATRVKPEDISMWITLGNLLLVRALHEEAVGGDAMPWFQELVASQEVTAKASPGPEGFRNLAYSQVTHGLHVLFLGQDPRELIAQGIDNSLKALDKNPGDGPAHLTLGLAYGGLAQWNILIGENPENLFESSIRSLEENIRLFPEDPSNHFHLARILMIRGASRLDQGLPADATLRAATKTLTLAAGLQKDSWELRQLRGNLALLKARMAIQGSGMPETHFAHGSSELLRSLELKPGNARTYLDLAELHLWRAQWLIDVNRPSGEVLEEGLRRAQKALEINPQLVWAWVVRAGLLELTAREATSAEDKGRVEEQSRNALARALASQPLLEDQARRLMKSLSSEDRSSP